MDSKRDDKDATDFVITQEMIEAGMEVLMEQPTTYPENDNFGYIGPIAYEQLVIAIFRAMCRAMR